MGVDSHNTGAFGVLWTCAFNLRIYTLLTPAIRVHLMVMRMLISTPFGEPAASSASTSEGFLRKQARTCSFWPLNPASPVELEAEKQLCLWLPGPALWSKRFSSFLSLAGLFVSEGRDGPWAWGEAVSSAPCKLLIFCHILHCIKPSLLSPKRETPFGFRGQMRDPRLSPWAPRSPWALCRGLLSHGRAQQGLLCWASASLLVYSRNMAGGPAGGEEGRAPQGPRRAPSRPGAASPSCQL